jgi:pimeloyl-[acyl-carrier protein] methyl ester esterase
VKLRRMAVGVLVALAVATLVQADGAGLETLTMGAGPSVVLVPGLGGTRTDWLPTVKRLREHYRCVMVEIPGQGKSPLPDPFSLEAAAQALDDVVAQQKGDSTIIVGVGVGGLLALMSANAHPDHQRGVVLIDVPIKSPIPIADQERKYVERFMDENFDQFAKMAFSNMGRDSTESARLYAMLAAVQPVTIKAYIRELLGTDGNRGVKNLQGSLALVFTERMWKPNTSWGTIAKTYGYEDSTLVTPVRISNTGPMVMKDQPDTLAALVADFATRRFAAKK